MRGKKTSFTSFEVPHVYYLPHIHHVSGRCQNSPIKHGGGRITCLYFGNVTRENSDIGDGLTKTLPLNLSEALSQEQMPLNPITRFKVEYLIELHFVVPCCLFY